MGVTYFSGSEPQYALRSYLVLVGLARTRSTITYEDLSDIIHRGGAHMMANALRPLRDWCRNNDLPPLTVLVVNKNTGLPGEGVEVANVPKAFADVYAHDWFEHLPPTLKEMGAEALPHMSTGCP